MNQRYYGKGRLKAGVMNRTEQAFERRLKDQLFRCEILAYKFEGYGLKFAKKTTYTPDFAVLMPDGEIVFYEVKGAKAVFLQAARIKVKIAAEMHWHRIFMAYPQKTGWLIEEVLP